MTTRIGPEYHRNCTIFYTKPDHWYRATIRWPADLGLLPDVSVSWLKIATDNIDLARRFTIDFIDSEMRDPVEFVQRFNAAAE